MGETFIKFKNLTSSYLYRRRCW